MGIRWAWNWETREVSWLGCYQLFAEPVNVGSMRTHCE